jgi:ligand-binding SRPBCC domain-containing protein
VKTYTLHKEQFVPRPLHDVFAFFERPENLAAITPPWLRFRMVTPAPIVMKPGTIIEYRITTMGLPMRWISVISEYDPLRKFVDEQVVGPYSLWHHTHTFVEVEGGTRILDDIRYALPLGPIGRLARTLRVANQLEEIFRYRKEVIHHLFGGPAFT